MKILQVNTLDQAGGAEQIAWQLFEAYAARGHNSWLAVGKKTRVHPNILTIESAAGSKLWEKTYGYLVRKIRKTIGHQVYRSPGSWRLLDLPPQKPEIIHAHNLHGHNGYFDLRALPELTRRLPFALTLHDAWLSSGHCAHSFDCERWRTGCGECPDLTIYPAIRRDATAFNWRQRKNIFEQCKFFLATPSRWLLQKMSESILAPAIVESRVIPNGVDLSIFQPGDRASARAALGLPPEARILLFAANGIRKNPWKDFQTLRAAIGEVAVRKANLPLVFIALGDTSEPEQIGRAKIQFLPFEPDPRKVAQYYQAADVYLHAARADTFPTVVLEAMACGCPVIATAVGGIPEQVVHDETGFLVPAGDAQTLAAKIIELLEDDATRARMSAAAIERAGKLFGLDQQVDQYLGWYEKILARQPSALV